MSEAKSGDSEDDIFMTSFRWRESDKARVVEHLDYGDSISGFIRDAIECKLYLLEEDKYEEVCDES